MSAYPKTRAALAAFDAAANDFLADDQDALKENLHRLAGEVESAYIHECPTVERRYLVLGSLNPTNLSPGHLIGDSIRLEVTL